MDVQKKIYFASDTHFGAKYFKDPIEKEKCFVRWLDSIKSDCGKLYLLGDMIDFWYEFKTVVPKGYSRFLGKIAEFSDSGIEVHWFTGNHDIWIFDYISKETGAIIHRQPLVVEENGKRFFLAHGDGLGDDSRAFRFMRALFHNKFLQKMFTWVHPRWSVAFGLNWSSHSRCSTDNLEYLGEDKEHLILYARDYLRDHHVDFFVFGHRHILLDLMLTKSSRVLILGDWIQYNSFAVFDGSEMWLDQFEK